MEIRVIYNNETKTIIDVVDPIYTTSTQHEIMQDTSDNCITALNALGIDTSPIKDFLEMGTI